MALKDTWVDRTTDDYIEPKTINEVAKAIIELEEIEIPKPSEFPILRYDDIDNPIIIKKSIKFPELLSVFVCIYDNSTENEENEIVSYLDSPCHKGILFQYLFSEYFIVQTLYGDTGEIYTRTIPVALIDDTKLISENWNSSFGNIDSQITDLDSMLSSINREIKKIEKVLPKNDENNLIEVASTKLAVGDEIIKGGYMLYSNNEYDVTEGIGDEYVELLVERTSFDSPVSDNVTLNVPVGDWDFVLHVDSVTSAFDVLLTVNDISVVVMNSELHSRSLRELINKSDYFSNESVMVSMGVTEIGNTCSLKITAERHLGGKDGLMSSSDKATLDELKSEVGDIGTALDELHAYAQALIGGEQ